MSVNNLSPSGQQLKANGEACMRRGDYTEAFFHWTHALKLHPDQVYFLDQRCKCFLKSDQHFLALQDAQDLIRLEPLNPLGYQRKAEVLYAAQQYEQAIQVHFIRRHSCLV